MNTYNLRTLTKKSTFWFGKYEGVSIQQLLNLNRHTYLRWIYYNIEGISFMDDVLKEITIRGERKIEKPGSMPEMHKKVTDENFNNMSIGTKSHMKKITKVKKEVNENKTIVKSVERKFIMQAKNQNRY